MDNEHIGIIGQIKIYTGKCFRLFKTEKQWKNFVSAFFIVLLIAMVTGAKMFTDYEATKKGAFAIVCAGIWIGLFNSIQSICRERDIIKREYRSGMNIAAFILAHTIYEAALCAAEAAIVWLVTAIRNIGHLPTGDRIITGTFLDMYLTIFLIIFVSDMLAILVSSAVRTEQQAMTIMPFVLIIQLLMSGMVFELEGLSEGISFFTISRWGLDAILVVAHAENLAFFKPEGLDATAGNLMQLWMKLILFGLVYIFVAIQLLKKVDKDTR